MSFENLKHIFEEHGTNTGEGTKAFFETPAGGPVPQPYSGNPPNSNLIDFNTNTNTLLKAFFSSPIGGPIPQPYNGNPPNSNLIDFNSNQDNYPAEFNTPTLESKFNEAVPNELFSEPAFPSNYTPQNTLNADGFFVNNDVLGKHGWPDLYTPNHKSINITNPSPRAANPFQPRRGGLDIKTDIGSRTSGIGLLGNLLNSSGIGSDAVSGANILDGREPYVVSRIPKDGDGNINGRLINFGSSNLPFARALTDTFRVGKYLTSTKGILNIALKNADLFIPQTVVKSKVTGFKNDQLIQIPQRFNNGYDPLSTLIQVSPLARLIGQSSIQATQSGIIKNKYGDDVAFKLNETFIGGVPANRQIGDEPPENLLNASVNGVKIVSKFTTGGDKATLAEMITGESLTATGEQTKGDTSADVTNYSVSAEKDGMPVYFKDLRDNKYIFFRGYVDGITESITPSWSESTYLGRSEPVYVYERAIRSISFNLTLMAQTEFELKKIYEKMDKLTSLCYPEYATDVLSGNTRMKPPLTKFRMGELFGKTNQEELGFIESLTYTVPENSTYESNPDTGRVPKYLTVAITYKVIHESVPDIDTNFYGINKPENA